MIVRPLLLPMMMTVIVAAFSSELRAAEINGVVRSSTPEYATVTTDSDLIPQPGDTAQIFFKMPGTSVEVSVASGQVYEITGQNIMVKIDKATGEVAKDQLVRIKADKPQKRSAIAATPSVAASVPASPPPSSPVVTTQGKNPSFAFADMNRIFQEHPKRKESETKINQVKNTAKQEYDRRAAANEPGLSEWKKAQEKQLGAQASKMREELVAEIRAKIKELGGQEVNLLLDVSGNSLSGVPFVVHFPASADMSGRVIAAVRGLRSDPFAAARGLQIGFVNMTDVFKRYHKTKEAEEKINSGKNAAKKEYDRRAATYTSLQEKLNELNRKLESASATTRSRLTSDRDSKIAELKRIEQEINAFRTTKEKELQDQAMKMREEIVAEINGALRAKTSAEKSVLIFDSSGQSSKHAPLFIFNRQLPDLSDDLVSSLNAGSSFKASAPSLTSSDALRFACIDMDRAVAAFPGAKVTEADATKKQQAILLRITESVRQLAETQQFDVVFDSSGQSLNGLPVLISTHGLPDLTDKVIANK